MKKPYWSIHIIERRNFRHADFIGQKRIPQIFKNTKYFNIKVTSSKYEYKCPVYKLSFYNSTSFFRIQKQLFNMQGIEFCSFSQDMLIGTNNNCQDKNNKTKGH